MAYYWVHTKVHRMADLLVCSTAQWKAHLLVDHWAYYSDCTLVHLMVDQKEASSVAHLVPRTVEMMVDMSAYSKIP